MGNSHPNIVKVLRSGKLANSSFWFVDMELCHLSLRNFLEKQWPRSLENAGGIFARGEDMWATMRAALAVMEDVTKGVSFIRSSNMVHRDIKPENGKWINCIPF